MKINIIFNAIYLFWIYITYTTGQNASDNDVQSQITDPIFPPSLMNIFNDLMQQTFEMPVYQHNPRFENYMQKKKQRRKKIHKYKQETIEEKQFDEIIEKQLAKATEFKEKAELLKNLHEQTDPIETASPQFLKQNSKTDLKEDLQNLPILIADEKKLEKEFEEQIQNKLADFTLNSSNEAKRNMITSTIIGDIPNITNTQKLQNLTLSSTNSNLNQINTTKSDEGFQKYYKFYIGDSYKIYFILSCVVLIALIVLIKSGKALLEALTNRRQKYQQLPGDKTTKQNDSEALI